MEHGTGRDGIHHTLCAAESCIETPGDLTPEEISNVLVDIRWAKDQINLMALDFATLRRTNVRRTEVAFHTVDSWDPWLWSNAMAGESGEVCNLTKKMARGEIVAKQDVADEIADVIIYADLLAARMGIDLSEAVRRKFNIVSDRRGCNIKL